MPQAASSVEDGYHHIAVFHCREKASVAFIKDCPCCLTFQHHVWLDAQPGKWEEMRTCTGKGGFI